MNLNLVPHHCAMLAASAAFAVAWAVGLIADVPVESIALRALLAAAAFWVVGLVMGKMFLNVVAQAVEEQVLNKKPEEKAAQRKT